MLRALALGLVLLAPTLARGAEPAQVLALLGVKPGDYGADLIPQTNDWTTRLSDAVGPQGKLCVFVPAELKDAPGDPQGRVKALAAQRPNIRPCLPPLAANGGHDVFDFALMADAQGVLHGATFKAEDVAGFHKTLLEELKPGAPYVVVGRPGDRDPGAIRKELEAAGYRFDSRHEVGDGRTALRFVKPN